MRDRSISLMCQIEGKKDPDGFSEENYSCMEHVPAAFQDITRNDQILANQSGYEADQNIEIMACNYHGETLVVDEETGELYEVVRTFRPAGSRRILMTCRRRERGTVKGKKDGTV